MRREVRWKGNSCLVERSNNVRCRQQLFIKMTITDSSGADDDGERLIICGQLFWVRCEWVW